MICTKWYSLKRRTNNCDCHASLAARHNAIHSLPSICVHFWHIEMFHILEIAPKCSETFVLYAKNWVYAENCVHFQQRAYNISKNDETQKQRGNNPKRKDTREKIKTNWIWYDVSPHIQRVRNKWMAMYMGPLSTRRFCCCRNVLLTAIILFCWETVFSARRSNAHYVCDGYRQNTQHSIPQSHRALWIFNSFRHPCCAHCSSHTIMMYVAFNRANVQNQLELAEEKKQEEKKKRN